MLEGRELDDRARRRGADPRWTDVAAGADGIDAAARGPVGRRVESAETALMAREIGGGEMDDSSSDSAEESAVGSESVGSSLFGPVFPWFEVADTGGEHVALVPLPMWPTARAEESGFVWSTTVDVFATEEPVFLRPLSGLRLDEYAAWVEEGTPGGVPQLEIGPSVLEGEVADYEFVFELAGDVDVDAADLVLYGNGATVLGARGSAFHVVPLIFEESSGDDARIARTHFVLGELPHPIRAMIRADGFRPVFLDLFENMPGLGAAMSVPTFSGASPHSRSVRLAFEPGHGGVVVGSYQNHRADDEHLGPASSFDVRLASEDHGRENPWTRLAPMGYAEFAWGPDGPTLAADACSVPPPA
ncbi:MAG: hypothetical protein R3F34_11130 [Planctomycetota bacterium]